MGIDPASDYKQDDIILVGASFYKANEDIPAGTPFAEGATGATWSPVGGGAGAPRVPTWSTVLDYVTNELVQYGGVLYRAKGIVTNGSPFDPTEWEAGHRLGQPNIIEFRGNINYLEGDLTVYNGRLYRANINYRGVWDDSRFDTFITEPLTLAVDFDNTLSLLANEVVFQDGQLWRAKADRLPGAWVEADFEPLTQSTESNTQVLDFSGSQDYAENDIVKRGNDLYRFTRDHTAGAWAIGDVELIAVSQLSVPEFDAGEGYGPGDVVSYGNSIRRANTNIPPAAFDVTNWDILGERSHYRGIHSNTFAFLIDDVVQRSNKIYQANSDIAIGVDFAEGNGTNGWTEISVDEPTKVLAWATGTDYAVGTLVYHDGLLYRCNSNHTAPGTFDDTPWDIPGADSTHLLDDYDTAHA